jgi:hypothetical protein
MNRDLVLQTAAAAISGDRDDVYGSPEDNWVRIADMWTAILGYRITPTQTGLCMIAVKMSRLVNTPAHADSWVDIAGYAALASEVATD